VTDPSSPWVGWAPPLTPPAQTGLPAARAQQIADAVWDDDPHLCAAIMWEEYAATLPPSPAVASVQTGVQSVSYGSPVPGGELGLALGRAAWHRSFCSPGSVPLEVARISGGEPPPGVWWPVEPI
jgi:hypothetical protein